MGETQRIPRRPAILDYAQTEAIVGAQDVADSSVLAHSTAWALLSYGPRVQTSLFPVHYGGFTCSASGITATP